MRELFNLVLTFNLRFKGFIFGDLGFGFELPKQLAVSDIAIRILHTQYDHLSLRSRMAHPEIHVANPRCDRHSRRWFLKK